MNWPELVAGAVLGALLQYGVIVGTQYYRSRQGQWHGVWYEVLPPFQGLSERWDKLSLTQDGDRIRGTARRLSPHDERKRRWKFEGYVAGDKMIGFFYLTRQKIDPASYVPIVMTRDVHSRHEAIWRGFYLRPAFMSEEDILTGRAVGGTMWWQRSHPQTARHGTPFIGYSQQVRVPIIQDKLKAIDHEE